MSSARSRGRSRRDFHTSLAPRSPPSQPQRRPLSPRRLLAVSMRRGDAGICTSFHSRRALRGGTNAVLRARRGTFTSDDVTQGAASQTVSIYSGGSPQSGHYPPCQMCLWNCCAEILYGSLKWSVWEVNGKSGECVQRLAGWESPHPRHSCSCCVFTESFS